MDSIKDVVRSSVKVPEFDKHLNKAGGHISRNVVEITIKMKTIVRKIIELRLRNLDNLIFDVYILNIHKTFFLVKDPIFYCVLISNNVLKVNDALICNHVLISHNV